MNREERKILAKQPIVWKGDLSDDCTAVWAGLMLRAEWMQGSLWWWAVYDKQGDDISIKSSNDYSEKCTSGKDAREKAEAIARNYISTL